MKAALANCPDTYKPYVELVHENDVIDALEISAMDDADILRQLDEEMTTAAYAENKWSVAELIQHIIDAERIFAYRALRIARGDKENQPGYDHDQFALYSHANERTLDDLADELEMLRHATAMMFTSFTPETLLQQGITNGNTVTVEMLAYIILGHARHHMQILQEKYL